MPNRKWVSLVGGLFLASLFVPALAGAANIIWVSDNKTGLSTPADKGWVDLLKTQGYNVDYQGQGGTGTQGYQFWRTLDATKIATLNAADLIILSRDLDSGNYASNATEIANWNALKKPLLMVIGHVARNNRWLWLNTDTTNDVQVPLQAVKLDHPIFSGVTLDAKNQVSVVTTISSICAATDAGNGTVIGTRADNGQVWIAEWKAGQPFYSGSSQTPAGQRLLFAAGATGTGGTDGTYNLTPDGQRMFLNAVRYLLGDAGRPCAVSPHPADQATDVPHDVTLSWTAGKYAATHDVYVGTDVADVNNATAAQPLNVLAGQGQTATAYTPAGLKYGQTYFWRVDEVNAPPSTTVVKGTVWSFTVEPYAYPIPGKSITASASSAQNGMGPENTINGSGLDASDLHGTDNSTMWMSAGAAPNWIQYQFDAVYKLYDMKVWNSNGTMESFIGFGAKDVKIEYSPDGATWTELPNVPPFARAAGTVGYAANTTVSFGGVTAQYVKLTITSNWGGVSPVVSLSEVRFSYVPVQARLPQPADGATGQSVTTILSWRPGRTAASHQVFFGTDPNAVAKGTAAVKTVTDHSFDPGPLNFGTTYYWRVDEVNAITYPGAVWSFSTLAYGVLDDFESYTDQPGSAMFETWVDGYDTPTTNGATVGNTDPTQPIAEITIVHGGKQAMPFSYDNSKASRSEATRTFTPAQNWTLSGIKSLSLWLQGVAANTGGQLYVKINSVKVPYDGSAGDLTKSAWIPWNIDLSPVGGLSNVKTLTLGVEGAGAKGKLYFDDIRLYPTSPQYAVPVDPGKADLVALWALEGDAKDTSGHNLNGTVKQANFAASGRAGGGQALQVQAAGYVDLGNPPALDFGTGDWALTAWYQDKMTGTADANKGTIIGKGGDNTGGKRYGLITGESTSGVVTLVTDDDVTKYVTNSKSVTNDGQWHFVVGQRTGGTTLQIWIDGNLEGSTTIPAAYDLSGTAQHNAYLGAMTNHTNASLYKLFSGLIDEVHVYHRALTAGEIVYLAGLTTPVALPF